MNLDKKTEAIRSLTSARFILFPLAGNTKIPPKGLSWDEVPHGKYGEKELIGANYGIALGDDDLVVDVDPRNFGSVLPSGKITPRKKNPDGTLVPRTSDETPDNPLKRLMDIIGPLNTFVVQTGSKGLHIFLKIPKGFQVIGNLNKKGFFGLDTKHKGGYVVAAGSVHPDTGGIYQIVKGSPDKIMAAPQELLTLVEKKQESLKTEGTGTYIDDEPTRKRYTTYLKKKAPLSIQGQGGDANAFVVAAVGRDFALPPERTLELMMDCWNPRCSPSWAEDDLRTKVDHAYRYASSPVGASHPSLDFKVEILPSKSPSLAAIMELADPISGPDGEPHPILPKNATADSQTGKSLSLDSSADGVDWSMSVSGNILKNFHNLINYLKAPGTGLQGIFAYNEFSCEVEFSSPAPWHRGKMPYSPTLTDADLKLLKAHLAIRNAFERSVTEIEEAVTVVARAKRFHPVREFLQGLVWDKTPRLDFWLRDFLGVEDNEFTRAVARKTLCAAIARVSRPGCKFDYTLILEGDQGVGKSELCRILGGEWSADFAVDPANKDTIQYMQGRWIIELADLQVHKVAEINALKAFLTRPSDRVRLAYGRLAVEYPRQSIFIGSFNPGADGTYLKDDTGNRRYWTVKCNPTGPRGKLDFAKFKAIRNQLWAEAYWRMSQVKGGEPLYMETDELEKAAAAAVALRHAEHPWTERVGNWLEGIRPRKDFVTAREVFVDALSGIDKQLDTRTMRGIAQALKALGWKPDTQRVGANGRPVRGYSRIALAASGEGTPLIETQQELGIEDLEREHALGGSGLL